MMNEREAGRALARVSGELARLSRDQMTRRILEGSAVQLELGAVRLMLLGNSNAGKSTLINALLGTIAVPESRNTSSPIPVWFGAGEGEDYRIYADGGEGENLLETADRAAFIRKYCFSVNDILDDKRARFDHIGWAAAHADSPLLRETGITLIDSLGIAATDADTAKTIRVIDSGVDLVVFVTSHVEMQQSEIAFLREKVLGLESREVPYPIRPAQLLIVYNDHGAGGTHEQMCAAADKLLAGCAAEEIAAFKEKNLIMLDALAARLARCGAYDYLRFAPEGTPEIMMEALRRQAATDKQALEINGEQIARRAKAFDALESRIRELAHAQVAGQDGAVLRRIIHLEAVIREIRSQANADLSRLQGDRAAIRQRIDSVRALGATFASANESVDATFERQRQDMMAAVACTLRASESAQKAIVGKVYELTEPPAFITPESVREFFASTRLEQEKMLEAWIRSVIEKDFLPEASRQFKTTLLEASAQPGDMRFGPEDTVSYQLAQARRLTLQQGTRMKNFCDQLRRSGAEDIGLSVPDDRTIETWAADMASTMETAILQSIASLQEEAYRKFNDKLPEIVRTIVGRNILTMLGSLWMRLTGNVKKFWKAVRDTAVHDAAAAICAEWFDANLSNAGNDMYFGIDRAYGRVQKNVAFSLSRQNEQVEAYLRSLETRLAGSSETVEAASVSREELETALAAQEEALGALREVLEG